MGSHESDSLNAVDFFHLPKKLRKGNGHIQIFSIGIDILSKEHDLLHPILGKLLNFPEDILRVPASFPASYIRYDTVAAEIIASKHDINSGFERIFSFYRKIFHDLVSILPDIHDHAI